MRVAANRTEDCCVDIRKLISDNDDWEYIQDALFDVFEIFDNFILTLIFDLSWDPKQKYRLDRLYKSVEKENFYLLKKLLQPL